MPSRKQTKIFQSPSFNKSIRPLIYEPIISPCNGIVFEPEITAVSSIGQFLRWLIVIIISLSKQIFKSIEKYSFRRTTPLSLYITSGLFIFVVALYLWVWKQYLLYDLLFRLLVSVVKLAILYL